MYSQAIRKGLAALTAATFLLGALTGCAALDTASDAGPDGPSYTEYVPAGGRGPTVILLSGGGGPSWYRSLGQEFAEAGYYTVLIDSNAVECGRRVGEAAASCPTRMANLRNAILRAQRSPHAGSGKVGVVGYSLGGSAAVAQASQLDELVAVVVAYYPALVWVDDLPGFVRRIKVPVLAIPGADDDSRGCCLAARISEIGAAARARGATFDVAVMPASRHSFNLPGTVFNPATTETAHRLTLAALRRHLGE